MLERSQERITDGHNEPPVIQFLTPLYYSVAAAGSAAVPVIEAVAAAFAFFL
jgi:hypothetical protein